MKEWLAEYPEDLQANDTLNQYNTIDEALNGFIQTKSALGNSIRIPGDDAGDDDQSAFIDKLMERVPALMKRPDHDDNEFWKTFGTPEDATGYDMPEGATLPEGLEPALREMMLNAKLSKKQADTLIKDMSARGEVVTEEQLQVTQDEEKALRAEWGSAYDSRIKMIEKVKSEFFEEGMTPQALYKLGKAMLSGESEFAVQPEGQVGVAPDEAKARIAEIDANPAYRDKSHPQQASLVKKRLELLSLAYPGIKTDPGSLRMHG